VQAQGQGGNRGDTLGAGGQGKQAGPHQGWGERGREGGGSWAGCVLPRCAACALPRRPCCWGTSSRLSCRWPMRSYPRPCAASLDPLPAPPSLCPLQLLVKSKEAGLHHFSVPPVPCPSPLILFPFCSSCMFCVCLTLLGSLLLRWRSTRPRWAAGAAASCDATRWRRSCSPYARCALTLHLGYHLRFCTGCPHFRAHCTLPSLPSERFQAQGWCESTALAE